MSRARPEPAESYPRASASTLAFPWLLSTTVHSAVFVLLAMTLPAVRTSAPPAAGISLEASMLSSSGQEESVPSVQLDAPPEDGFFEDDEPVLYAEESDAPSSQGGAPSLESILAEEPAVAMSGVLPSMTAEAGLGGPEAGIPSATNLTSEAAPARRMQGGQARTGVFGLVGEGHKFVYVFDRSGSMDGHGGAPLVAAKSQLLNSLEDLGQTHQFQIIFYNEQPRIFSPSGDVGRLVFGTDQNKNLARRFVGSITASGATRHVEALQMALRMAPDVIFFLTDADEPRMTPSELARIAQMNRGTTIHTIEFGTSPQADADNFIVRLARQNGGQHVYIDVTRLSSNRR
jgi:hypothetical protein